MESNWVSVKGTVVRGHRVASAPSRDYPYGTIEKQKPYFKESGLDLDQCFNGTLNVSIQPFDFELTNPEIILENVNWTELHPPETFSFSRCTVIFREREYPGWIYFPHPETKRRHFQGKSALEIICEKIPNLGYGDLVAIMLNRDEIRIKKVDE